MEKAYDIKELGQRIIAEAKKDGLVILEDAAEKLAKASYIATKGWAKDSAVLSETKIDDFLAPYYDALDAVVMPKIDAIDLDGDGK